MRCGCLDLLGCATRGRRAGVICEWGEEGHGSPTSPQGERSPGQMCIAAFCKCILLPADGDSPVALVLSVP